MLKLRSNPIHNRHCNKDSLNSSIPVSYTHLLNNKNTNNSLLPEDSDKCFPVYYAHPEQYPNNYIQKGGPRKLVVKDKPQDGDDSAPPAGDADITLRKVAAGTTLSLIHI